MKKHQGLIPVLAILLTGLVMSCASRPLIDDTCVRMQTGAKPAWTDSDPGIDGYYTGVGFGSKGDQQFEVAKKNALSAMSEAIKVHVRSELNITLSDDSVKGVSSETSRHLEHSVQSVSSIDLSDISEAGRWLDKDNCLLWVRLKVKRSLVDQIILLKKVEDGVAKAMDKKTALMPKDRLKLVDEAFLTLNMVDFKQLPAHYGKRTLYETQCRDAQDTLKKQSATGKVLFTVFGKGLLSAEDKKALAEHFMKGMNGKAIYLDTLSCSDEQTCIDAGRGNNASALVLIGVDTDVAVGAMGMWKGTLSMTVTVSDIGKGKRIADRISNSGNAFSFDKTMISWRGIAEKMFSENKFEAIEKVIRSL